MASPRVVGDANHDAPRQLDNSCSAQILPQRMQPPLHNQDCPLCSRSARYFFAPGSDGSRKEFSCPHCREFSITRDAENRIGARPMLAALCSDLARDTPEAMLLHVRLRLIIVGAQTKMEIVGDYERRGQ